MRTSAFTAQHLGQEDNVATWHATTTTYTTTAPHPHHVCQSLCSVCSTLLPSRNALSTALIARSHTGLPAANADDHNDNDDDADAAPQQPTSAAGTDAPATDEMPVVRNLFDWLQSAFVEYTN